MRSISVFTSGASVRRRLTAVGGATDTVAGTGAAATAIGALAMGDLDARFEWPPAGALMLGGGGMPPLAAVSASFNKALSVLMQLWHRYECSVRSSGRKQAGGSAAGMSFTMNEQPCGRYFSMRAFSPADMYRFESSVRLHAWQGCTGLLGAFRDDGVVVGVAVGVGVMGDGCTETWVVVACPAPDADASGGTVADVVAACFVSMGSAACAVTGTVTTCAVGWGAGDDACGTVSVAVADAASVAVMLRVIPISAEPELLAKVSRRPNSC